MKPCIPPELKATAAATHQRVVDAIERLQALAVDEGALEEPPNDPIMIGLRELIDADKKIVMLRRKA